MRSIILSTILLVFSNFDFVIKTFISNSLSNLINYIEKTGAVNKYETNRISDVHLSKQDHQTLINLVPSQNQIQQIETNLTEHYSANYFQNDPNLSDLLTIDNYGVRHNMLCWPTALSYQLRFQLQSEHPRQAKFLLADSSLHDLSPTQEIRAVTKLCNTDQNFGTSLPQGAHCISNIFKTIGIPLKLKIIGADASWAEHGMFPHGTEAIQRRIQDNDIIDAINQRDSIIALIGFYKLKGSIWVRESGHFVSITGYKIESQNPKTLRYVHIVNPSVKYAGGSELHLSDKIRVNNKVDFFRLGSDVSYTLSGEGVNFSEFETGLESLLIFSSQNVRSNSQISINRKPEPQEELRTFLH